jgi:hypothetical protein
MAERFFVDQVLAPGRIEVDGPEAHHLATVCRLRPGDAVYLFNGDGSQYPAVVAAVGRRKVELEVSGTEKPICEFDLPPRDRRAFAEGRACRFPDREIDRARRHGVHAAADGQKCRPSE